VLYSDSEEIEAKTGDIKKQILVGICGSFSDTNKPILNDLKDYLNQNGYRNIYTAEDFPYEKPSIANGDAKYGFTYEKCMDMVNNCQIVIIFFFKSDQDPEVNQSAITEIQELCSKRKRNVIVLTEEGFKLRSNLKGIKYRSFRDKWWPWQSFSRNEIPDCYESVKQTCHNLILERFLKRNLM